MLVAIAALIVATSSAAVAATALVSGDKLIAKHSLSGNRLRNHTITGKQVNLNKLGKVPTAKSADRAGTAVLAHAWGPEAATGFFHMTYGKVVYGVMMIPFVAGVLWLRRGAEASETA